MATTVRPVTSRSDAAVEGRVRPVVLDGRGVWAYGRWRTPGAKGDSMYPGPHACERAYQAAFVMASTGESVSYAEYEARTNRLAHLLRATPGTLGVCGIRGCYRSRAPCWSLSLVSW